jgi:hypothetical protein
MPARTFSAASYPSAGSIVLYRNLRAHRIGADEVEGRARWPKGALLELLCRFAKVPNCCYYLPLGVVSADWRKILAWLV